MSRVWAATLVAGLAAGLTMAPNISGATGDTAARPQAQGQTIAAVSTTALNLMPMPSTLQLGSGQLEIASTFSVALKGYTEPRLDRASQRFMRGLAGVTGLSIGSGTADASKPLLTATTDHASAAIQNIDDDESYTLDVTPTGATIHAPTPLGTMHGFQTFLQLVQVTPTGFAAPSVHIQDTPRFAWRGLMIDSGRHFTPIDTLKRNIDGMEAVKLNVFHWHLSENQGFRVESKVFPKLTELGSDGLFYTQAEVKEIVEYCRDRGIRVMPEFDMPGHATAWFVGYPQIASGTGPYKIEREWGVFDPAMDPTKEETYKFLEKLAPRNDRAFPGPVLPHRRRRSERQGMGRESQNPGVHEGARPEGQQRAAALLQRARREDSGKTPQDAGRMG